MENYNNEREHDWCLIYLVRALDETDRLDIFRDAFRIEEDLGPLRWSGRRRAFDVELEFANLSVAIETKVHSNEEGGDGEQWQTERIAEIGRFIRRCGTGMGDRSRAASKKSYSCHAGGQVKSFPLDNRTGSGNWLSAK